MLTRFEVSNYKGFKNNIIWDLTTVRDYSFSKNLIKNKIAKNSIVYGKNASGKTSLCSAIVDITTHLLDVEKDLTPSYMYTYIGNNTPIATFQYDFIFGKKKVVYKYVKTDTRDLLLEILTVNGKTVIYHDFVDESKNFIKIPEAKNLRTKGLQKQLSVIKYIYNNTIIDDESVITLLLNFVKGMLYFRSLREANQYIGYKLGGDKLDDIILRNGRLEAFNEFLKIMELNYDLVPLKLSSGNLVIGARFENDKVIAFNEIASSGTRTLMLFFCWLLEFENLSFLIIDEFDAYYHYEVSRKILEIINCFDNMQSMVTTHNVTLLNTEQTRPECAFILDETGVRNLSSRTNRELRKNNNIEKLYREGEFEKDI
ncbi:MAG: ATP-binding protein [Oscillospiraceae bacterium]|nr:ATP-binding protein [Oscillospiraceae bacterium]